MNKNEILHNFVKELKANGYNVYTSDTKENYSYIYFVKNNKIGYMQSDYFSGVRFSSVHKPCTECGTGYALQNDGIEKPTMQNAEEALNFFAMRGDEKYIKKYSGWDEFLKRNTILEYKEIE